MTARSADVYGARTLRLYAGKIDSISSEIINTLVSDGDLELSNQSEAELDVAAVLKEYTRVDKDLTERAKDILEIRGLSHEAFGRTKRTLADKVDFGLGDEGINWVLKQLLETFMQSQHVDEIYAEDSTLRRKIRDIIAKHTGVDDQLDKEVRERLQNLEEGTQTWDIEYKRVLDKMKTKHGLGE